MSFPESRNSYNRPDPGFLRFVVLKSEASKGSWLAAATAAPRE
ncbi:hypothetical protein AK812_SmicGene47826, partial [Symbiodinium microadriaticum]